MSVVDIEIDEVEFEAKPGVWMCKECHKDLCTSMNIGYAEKGRTCARCNATRRMMYMIAGSTCT